MKTFLKVFFFVCSFLIPTAAWAQTPVQVSFDESLGTLTAPGGVTLTTGVLVLCDAFDTPTAPVCSQSNISDVVLFVPITGGGSAIHYFSDLGPGQSEVPGTAEVGIPDFSVFTNRRFILETVNEAGTETITYTPSSPNEPGFCNTFLNVERCSYNITSDHGPDTPTVPEPATLTLLGTGLLALGTRRRFLTRLVPRQRKT